jgi:hypothetical protein
MPEPDYQPLPQLRARLIDACAAGQTVPHYTRLWQLASSQELPAVRKIGSSWFFDARALASIAGTLRLTLKRQRRVP